MGALNTVFTALGSIVTGIVGVVVNVFEGVIPLWYTAPTTSGGDGELTILGVFSLIAFVVAMVFFGIKFIGSMISLKTAKR